MFCPQCKYEYRPGFTRCADCDVDLIPEPPQETAPGQDTAIHGADRRVIWEGSSEAACVDLCRKFREADIPYEVSRNEESRWFKMQSIWRYQITVPSAEAGFAQKIVDKSGAAMDQLADDDSALELPAEDAGYDDSPDDEDGDAEARALAYDQPFYPDEATEKICEEPDAEAASMIEASLKENYIHCRLESQESGPTQIFVLPDDAARAREIVREIRDASAPE